MSTRRRQRSSFGSVTKIDRDTWRLRWWADTPEGRRRVSETVHGTRRQAEDRLAEIRCEVGSEQGGSVTVGQAWERWWVPDARMRVEDGRYSPRSFTTAKSMWDSHVAPRWSDVPVSQIKPLDLQNWLLTLGDQAASKSKSVLRQVLDYCVLYEYVDRNVAASSYRMPSKAKKRDTDVYTLDELEHVARAVRGLPIEAAVLLSAFGSARVGESLGVMSNEVRTVQACGVPVAIAPIVRQVDNNDGTVTERLKTPQSKRVLAIPGPVGARLQRVADACLEHGLTWLCDDGTGSPIRQGRYLKMYKDAIAAAGLVHHAPSRLRNSWQTFMHWDMSVAPEMIEKMMGHSSRTVTAKHYDRPDEMQFAEAVARAYLLRPFADGWDI